MYVSPYRAGMFSASSGLSVRSRKRTRREQVLLWSFMGMPRSLSAPSFDTFSPSVIPVPGPKMAIRPSRKTFRFRRSMIRSSTLKRLGNR